LIPKHTFNIAELVLEKYDFVILWQLREERKND